MPYSWIGPRSCLHLSQTTTLRRSDQVGRQRFPVSLVTFFALASGRHAPICSAHTSGWRTSVFCSSHVLLRPLLAWLHRQCAFAKFLLVGVTFWLLWALLCTSDHLTFACHAFWRVGIIHRPLLSSAFALPLWVPCLWFLCWRLGASAA